MKLLRLHKTFLYTRRIELVAVIILSCTFIILLLQSNLLMHPEDFDISREYYIDNYVINGLTIVKIVIVLFSMFFSIYAYYISKYDVFLLTRKKRTTFLITKNIILYFIMGMFTTVLVLSYSCLWFCLDGNVSIYIIIDLWWKMILFGCYFSTLFSYIGVLFDNLFVYMIPFIGYLISNLSIDYGKQVKDFSLFSKIINLFFPDLIVINKQFEYVYGGVILCSIFLIVCMLIITNYKIKDIL